MKTFIKISYLSIILTTLTLATEPFTTSALTIKDMLVLRQMYNHFKNTEIQNFSIQRKQDQVCLTNKNSQDEVCIHHNSFIEILLKNYHTTSDITLIKMHDIFEQIQQQVQDQQF